MMDLATRQRAQEWMDSSSADPAELQRSLRFIRRVNRWLGYTRATIAHLEGFSRGWVRGQRVDIIDLATGSADLPAAILRWGQRRGFDLHLVGVDLQPTTIRSAARSPSDGRLTMVQADALRPPFADGSFDYAICSMFVHHLGETQIVELLRSMDRLARRGIIVADLLRHRRAYLWIKLFTACSTPMVRHDGPLSVAQALTRPEVLALRDRAGLSYLGYFRHWAHRFVLAGEKPGH